MAKAKTKSKRKKEHWKKREKRALSRGATSAFAKKYGLRQVTEEELDEHIRLRIKKTKTRTPKKGRKKTMAKKKRKTKKTKAKAKRKKAKRKTTKRKTTKRKTKTKAKRKTAKRKTAKRKTAKRKTAKRKTKRKTTKRRSAVETEVVRSVRVPKSKTQVVRVELTTPTRRASSKKKRKKGKRKSNPTNGIVRNPAEEVEMVGYEENAGYFGGLLGNPNGPFAAASLRGYAVAAGGVGAGLVIADFLDRFVATRTPDDSEKPESKANNPWFGRDAAAAQRRRPDAMRLGAQAAGAVAAMALTYWTRNGNILPWLFGGTAVGFGANLLKMLTDWYVMPAVFKVDDPTEDTFANRMFPLEQSDIQDEVDELFTNWAAVPALLAGQAEEPVIQSPLASPAGSAIYTLGKAGRGSGNGRPQPQGLGAPGTRRFVGKPNMLGKRCNSCGGYGGCWADCRTMTGYMETGNCAECGDGNHPAANEKQCAYTVQPGDNLAKIAQATGTSAELVSSLNQGRSLQDLSKAGTRTVLPYGMCMYISKMPEGASPPPPPPVPGNGGGAPPPPPADVRGNPVIPSTREGPMPGASNAAPFPPGAVPAQSVPPAMPPGTVPAQFGTTTMNVPPQLLDIPNAGMAGMNLAGKPNGDNRSAEERVMALFGGDD